MTQMKAFATRLDPRLIRAVKMQAAERGVLVQAAVTQALCQWLESSADSEGWGGALRISAPPVQRADYFPKRNSPTLATPSES